MDGRWILQFPIYPGSIGSSYYARVSVRVVRVGGQISGSQLDNTAIVLDLLIHLIGLDGRRCQAALHHVTMSHHVPSARQATKAKAARDDENHVVLP